MLDKIVEFVGRNPDGATAREVQQQVHLPSAELTKMYLDKLVLGRLTRVEMPPPKEKGGSYQGDLQVTGTVNFYGGPCYTCSLGMEVPLNTPSRPAVGFSHEDLDHSPVCGGDGGCRVCGEGP
jgi:hypothetical protein